MKHKNKISLIFCISIIFIFLLPLLNLSSGKVLAKDDKDGKKLSQYIGEFIREIWISKLTEFDNSELDKEDATVEFTLYGLEKVEEVEQIEDYDEDDKGVKNADVTAMLNSCQKIATYMKNNGFTYYPRKGMSGGTYGLRYNTFSKSSKSTQRVSCCCTYVSWVLQDIGLIRDSEHHNNVLGTQRLSNGRTVDKRGTINSIEDRKNWKPYGRIMEGSG